MDTTASRPLVSVLLPVWNGAPYLAEAIESVLNQTFRDFELLIINDGSTDGATDIISQYQDTRMRVISHTHQQGLVSSLNEGVLECRGTYIARMDGDDAMLPDRLKTQVAFLEAHPSIALAGTSRYVMDEHSVVSRVMRQETEHLRIKVAALFLCPFFHPTVMARRDVFRDHPYSDEYRHTEDYELWVRLLRTTSLQLANVDQPLLKYRIHSRSVTHTNSERHEETVMRIRREYLSDYLEASEVETLLQRPLKFTPRLFFQRLSLHAKLAAHFSKKEHLATLPALWAFYYCVKRLVREVVTKNP